MSVSKNRRTALNNLIRNISVFVLCLQISACSSPTDRANHYYEKGIALADKDPNEAIKQLQNALQLNKGMSQAYFALAKIAEKKQDYPSAFSNYSQVVELDPKNLEAQNKLGRLYIGGGKVDLAMQASEKILAIDTQNLDGLALRAMALLKKNDNKGAVEFANKVLSKNPDQIEALSVLAFERFTAKDEASAMKYIELGLKQDPKNISFWALKGNVFEQISDISNASICYEKIVELSPDNLDFKRTLVEFYLKNHLMDKAESQLHAIVDQFPTEIKHKIELVRFLIASKGVEAGRKALEAFVEKEPKNFSLKFSLVDLYQQQKDMEAAEHLLMGIVNQAKDSPDGLKAKGMIANIAISTGDKSKAQTLADEVLAVDKGNEQALLIKASLEIENKSIDAAVTDLRLVLKGAPNSARALLLLGSAYETSNSLDLADEQYNKAYQASKLAPPYAIIYAKFLLKRNQVARADDILNDAVKAYPKDISLLLMLADIKIFRGDWDTVQAIADRLKSSGDQTESVNKIMLALTDAKKKSVQSIDSLKQTYASDPSTKNLSVLIQAYLRAGQNQQAYTYLNSILLKTPNNVDAITLQGQLFMHESEYTKAEQVFKTLLEKTPDNLVGYRMLSSVYLHNNKFKEADELIKSGLIKSPADFELTMNQAALYERTARPEDAIKVYESLLKSHSDSDVVLNNLASLICETRKDKASLDHAYALAKKIKLTEVVQFKDTLGWASFKVGKNNDAQALLEEVVARKTIEPDFHYHLAIIYQAQLNKAKAKEQFGLALKAAGNVPYPHADEIRNLLKTL
jgi:tetratricopeptide (TPR) repeat protein